MLHVYTESDFLVLSGYTLIFVKRILMNIPGEGIFNC